MTESDTTERMILSEVIEVLEIGDYDEPVLSETPLVTSGLLDSLGVIRIALFLESKFSVDFSATQFDQRRFETVQSMRRLVDEFGTPGDNKP